MIDASSEDIPEAGPELGLNRREFGKRGAMLAAAAGAAWAAPTVYDSVSTPAAAAGTSLLDTDEPGTYTPTIPAHRSASFVIAGGGGGGGSFDGRDGGPEPASPEPSRLPEPVARSPSSSPRAARVHPSRSSPT